MAAAAAAAEPVWGVARQHQQAHPEAWTPELIEATACWTAVVRAITQDQHESLALLHGHPGPAQSFADRCDAEPELRRQLEQLCAQQLHGLLMEWLVAGVRERLAVHAVPQFWHHYRELASGGAAGGGAAGGGGVALQRACLASAFTAVARLHAYMRAQLRLVRLIDLKGWRHRGAGGGGAGAGAVGERGPPGGSRPTSVCSCSSGGSGCGSPMVADDTPADGGADGGDEGESAAAAEVLTVLGALLQGAAPEPQAFSQWMARCWERAFVDSTKAERSAAWAAGEEGEDEEEAEADSMQVDGDDEGAAPSVPHLRQQLRAFSAQLHELQWLPLVEPSLSATLHAQLVASALHPV
jgi:hypothetical protein